MRAPFLAFRAGLISFALVAGCATPETDDPSGAGGSAGVAGSSGAAGSSGGGRLARHGGTGVAGSPPGVAGSGPAGPAAAARGATRWAWRHDRPCRRGRSRGRHGGHWGRRRDGRGGATGGRGGTAGGATGGRGGTAGGAAGTVGGGGKGGTGGALPLFSFFVTSVDAMKTLSKNEKGFGGDLRFGETGDGAGLRGADKICAAVAEKSMPGSSVKQWRAFLSAVAGPVNAKDRIGTGPWYDRMGRKVGTSLDDLVVNTTTGSNAGRPAMADAAIRDDLPNEYGIPNHTDGKPGCTGNNCPDNHDVLTGTGPKGMLYMASTKYTCNDWTTAEATSGMGPWVGHSWPRQGSGTNWMSALREGGCAPGINLMEQGGPLPGVYTVGTGGGYGGIYCFALVP